MLKNYVHVNHSGGAVSRTSAVGAEGSGIEPWLVPLIQLLMRPFSPNGWLRKYTGPYRHTALSGGNRP